MQLIHYLKVRNLVAVFGYVLFIGMMAIGYYYNVTFIQLGLVDLGGRLLGLKEVTLVMSMAGLALMTCLVALTFGACFRRRAHCTDFRLKLKLAFFVVSLQALLTIVAPIIRSETLFFAWIATTSLTLGIGVPVTFSMTVDLIPVRDRGYVAALITAAAYYAAPVYSVPWLIDHLSRQMTLVMIPGVILVGILAFGQLSFVDVLARQHEQPEFGNGRFVRLDAPGRPRVGWWLPALIVGMFGIFFIDSLGFIRMVETPALMASAWLSPNDSIRVFIGVTHVIAAGIAGVLYTNFRVRTLFLWVFGLFAMTHLMYVFHIRLPLSEAVPLAMPMIYSAAVSIYTVVNFAIWADLSTPRTIPFNAALGVAVSGWTATFLSTALALRWRLAGMTLEQHLSLVNSLAILFFLACLILVLLPARTTSAGDNASPSLESGVR